MLWRCLIATLVLTVSLGLSSQGQEKGKNEKAKDEKAKGEKAALVWKFEKDKTFYQKMTTVTKQTMKVLNNDVSQTQNQTFIFSWTPTEQKGDDWTVTQKIVGVQMDIDLGGSKITYD